MEEVSFITQTLSLLVLLVISSFTYILSKKINFPYTVLLVLIGLLLVPISNIEFFHFIDDFQLTPDILFFVFLPVLLFEAAYNINYKQLLNNWKAITALAIFWLLISAGSIWYALYFLLPFVWFHIPLLVCLLFWVLISATDPVAVLSIFKSMWAPRRLTILFEGESLFNDGTAVALFLVILAIITEGGGLINGTTYLVWLGSFLSMLLGWMIFGAFTWILFSKIIWLIKNNEEVEIGLTMVLAHITFISAELISHYFDFLPISWVIATVIASMVIWNYGRYKITPRVEAHMQQFWEFFAFLANSIVFILMWLILSSLEVDFISLLVPLFIAIPIVMLARMLSVYFPIWIINIFKLEEHIPMSWQHLLSWWSLRWALALMMVLIVPGIGDPGYEKILAFQELVWWGFSFSIKDFLLVLTIGSIMFTLFIKAPTISLFMKKMGVDKLHKLERFEHEEWKILANLKILDKLTNSYKKAYLTQIEYDDLKNKYTERLKNAVDTMKEVLSWNQEEATILIRKAISMHALWIEKQYLKNLFYYNELDERNFKYIFRKLEKQMERVELESSQLRSISNSDNDYDIFSRLAIALYKRRTTSIDAYIRNRARVIVTRKVIKELRLLSEIDFGFDSKIFNEIIELYAAFHKSADEKRIHIFSAHKVQINLIESNLINKSLLKLEESILKDLYKKEIISPKLYIKFMEEVEYEMFQDVKKLA